MSNDNNDIVKSEEQIKNKSEKIAEFYGQLETYLGEDKYNLFKTKSKFKIDQKIKASNFQIQKLIDLKVKVKLEIDNLFKQRKLLKEKNQRTKNELVSKLELK